MSETLIQKVNRKTFGVVNPANATTIAARILVWRGADKLDTYTGNAEVAAGRVLDNADGYFARLFGVSSRFGAFLDATGDKIDVARLVWKNWKRKDSDRRMLGAFAIQNVSNMVATFVAETRGVALTPSKAGKHMMFAQSAALIMESTANAARRRGHKNVEITTNTVRRACKAAAFVMGTGASVGYIANALELPESHPKAMERVQRVVPESVLRYFMQGSGDGPDGDPGSSPNTGLESLPGGLARSHDLLISEEPSA